MCAVPFRVPDLIICKPEKVKRGLPLLRLCIFVIIFWRINLYFVGSLGLELRGSLLFLSVRARLRSRLLVLEVNTFCSRIQRINFAPGLVFA